jgi:hypothetical protein
MRNYTSTARATCAASNLVTNISITTCIQDAAENFRNYTSPVKEFWEYVFQIKYYDFN